MAKVRIVSDSTCDLSPELREKYDLHMKVERYLSDEAGIPGMDQSYIRE